MKAIVLLLAGLACGASAALANDVWVDGRVYFSSPDYYTSTLGDFAVSFRERLPFGSTVRVHYGFGGHTTVYESYGPRQVDVTWEDIDEADARAVSPYTWTAKLHHTLAERGAPYFYDSLQFVISVTLPGGEEYYVKGSDSRLGYFQAALPTAASGGVDAPVPLRRLDVVAVRRD
jgi:hypothetical protein